MKPKKNHSFLPLNAIHLSISWQNVEGGTITQGSISLNSIEQLITFASKSFMPIDSINGCTPTNEIKGPKEYI